MVRMIDYDRFNIPQPERSVSTQTLQLVPRLETGLGHGSFRQEEENHHKARVEHICLKGGVNELLATWTNWTTWTRCEDAISEEHFELISKGIQPIQPSNYSTM